MSVTAMLQLRYLISARNPGQCHIVGRLMIDRSGSTAADRTAGSSPSACDRSCRRPDRHRSSAGCKRVLIHASVRKRDERFEELLCRLAEPVFRDDVSGKCAAERIPQRVPQARATSRLSAPQPSIPWVQRARGAPLRSPLIRSEEERLIFPNGSAERASELVALERRNGIREEIACIQFLVSQEFEAVP